eukprot:1013523-Pyramimonas_sp.AAC.1
MAGHVMLHVSSCAPSLAEVHYAGGPSVRRRRDHRGAPRCRMTTMTGASQRTAYGAITAPTALCSPESGRGLRSTFT